MSTAAVESIAAVIAAARVSTVVATADEAVGVATPVAVTAVAVVASMSIIISIMAVVAVAVVTAATVESVAIVAAVVPGAGTDEDAAGEVVRPVVAVWSTGVRIVAVVTIGAGRCWPDGAVHGTYSNTKRNLCVSTSRGKKQNSQQSNIF
jgi:hypothetical protein